MDQNHAQQLAILEKTIQANGPHSLGSSTGAAAASDAVKAKFDAIENQLKGMEGVMHECRNEYVQYHETLSGVVNNASQQLDQRISMIEQHLSAGPAPAPAPTAAAQTQGPTIGGQPMAFPFTAATPSGVTAGMGETTAGPPSAAQSDGHPKFNRNSKKDVGTELFLLCGGGDRRSLFDDKVAVSSIGQYSEQDKRGWIRTTHNYLVSKAFEMAVFLPWAESAQEHAITHAHVNALTDLGIMAESDPLKFSKDLWGCLNLALTCKQKENFNNVEAGNGFEAWRRLAVPIAPRSEARLHEMQREVNAPKQSKKLSEYMEDLAVWEGELTEYHKCGGDPMSDKTKIIIALRMLPFNTPSGIKVPLKTQKDFEDFKDQVRSDIRFLQDFGGSGGCCSTFCGSRDAASP